MGAFLRHEGTIFPVFDIGAVAHTKKEMREQVREGLRKVTRSVRLFQIHDASLPATLNKADEIFSELAEACQGQVVTHRWGLYPSQGYNPMYEAFGVTPHLPEGYDLAVQTNTLFDLRPTNQDEFHRVYNAIHRHCDASTWPKWRDASATHFEANKEGLYLLDVEPLLKTDPESVEFCFNEYNMPKTM